MNKIFAVLIALWVACGPALSQATNPPGGPYQGLFVAPSTSGNVLQSNGSAWTSAGSSLTAAQLLGGTGADGAITNPSTGATIRYAVNATTFSITSNTVFNTNQNFINSSGATTITAAQVQCSASNNGGAAATQGGAGGAASATAYPGQDGGGVAPGRGGIFVNAGGSGGGGYGSWSSFANGGKANVTPGARGTNSSAPALGGGSGGGGAGDGVTGTGGAGGPSGVCFVFKSGGAFSMSANSNSKINFNYLGNDNIGGNATTGGGGGGGGAGGEVWIYSATSITTGAASVIQTAGGAGGNGAGNGDGGGGGAGGFILYMAPTLTISGTETKGGGAGGTKAGTGTNGTAGDTGNSVQIVGTPTSTLVGRLLEHKGDLIMLARQHNHNLKGTGEQICRQFAQNDNDFICLLTGSPSNNTGIGHEAEVIDLFSERRRVA